MYVCVNVCVCCPHQYIYLNTCIHAYTSALNDQNTNSQRHRHTHIWRSFKYSHSPTFSDKQTPINSWICERSGWKHQFVPKDLVKEAAEHAKAALDEDMDD